MATTKTKDSDAGSAAPSLTKAWNTAWEALAPIRATWTEKEQALIAQTNDSVSGNVTATRVSDAALSTLAYERQARVYAQFPTGRVYARTKADDEGAQLINIVYNRYIAPNANSQFDLLIKKRLWGLYASVYGSMPMFYDYRVDDDYVGPDCWLVDPRCFAPVEGMHNVQDAGCYISTIMHKTQLEGILKRKTTSYDTEAIKRLLKLMDKDRPTKDDDSEKTDTTVGQRYDLSNAGDRVEIVTKYTHKKWVSFAPDYADVDKQDHDLVIRDMENPHKSGKIPVVMRHCFPLLNSIFGLGDFERGMKIQKAKDSIINLFLEGAKNRIYPPLKMIDSQLTPSTIVYQAATKWKVKRQDAVEAMNFGQAPLSEFQATYSALQGMLQNQFGTSTTEISSKEGGPSMGKTPEALKMQGARENSRDNWDRFMAEKADEELTDGMINLLAVKMEKAINFTVFEEDIKSLGYQEASEEEPLGSPVKGLDVFDGNKAGKMTVTKDMIKPKGRYMYLIDPGSTMKQDDEEQTQAMMATWQLVHQDPALVQRLAMEGTEYDEAEHLKKIFISSGVSDWEKILKEMSPEKVAEMKQQMMMQEQQAQEQAMMAQQGQMEQPMEQGMAPEQDPAVQEMMAQLQQQQPMQEMPPEQPQGPQSGMPQFQDPDIAAVAEQMLGGF